MREQNHKRLKGFTLIEIVIVISIIGILAAIAIPNFRTYQDRGKTAAATATMKTLHIAVEAYQADNDCYPRSAGPNTAPVGLCPTYLAEWPDEETNPFNSTYDYQINNLNGQTCVGITFLGKDQSNNSQAGADQVGAVRSFSDSDDLFINLGCGVRICQ